MNAWRVSTTFAGICLAVIALSAMAPGASAATCDGESVACGIGDTGPGGGTVVYDAGSTQWWGRYLEVAPATWVPNAEDAAWVWCDKGEAGYARQLRTGVSIGTGAGNTRLVISRCGTASAAGAAAAYRGGGMADWFLPSRAELDQMFRQRALLDGLEGEQLLWSSSQAPQLTPVSDLPAGPTGRSARASVRAQVWGARLPVSAWAQDFMTGRRQAIWKWGAGGLIVRPMRAF